MTKDELTLARDVANTSNNIYDRIERKVDAVIRYVLEQEEAPAGLYQFVPTEAGYAPCVPLGYSADDTPNPGADEGPAVEAPASEPVDFANHATTTTSGAPLYDVLPDEATLTDLTNDQLRTIAERRGVTVKASATKAQLVAALLGKDA